MVILSIKASGKARLNWAISRSTCRCPRSGRRPEDIGIEQRDMHQGLLLVEPVRLCFLSHLLQSRTPRLSTPTLVLKKRIEMNSPMRANLVERDASSFHKCDEEGARQPRGGPQRRSSRQRGQDLRSSSATTPTDSDPSLLGPVRRVVWHQDRVRLARWPR